MAPVLGLFGYGESGTGVDPRTYGGTFTRADASTCATYIDANDVVQTVAADIPRYQHYDPANLTLRPLLLMEGARTNTVIQSSDMANVSWDVSNITSSVKNLTGPDGQANSACTLTFNGGATGAIIKITATATTAGGKATLSAFVKKGSNTWCWIGDIGDASNHRAWFNLDTGAFGTVETAGSTTSVVTLGGDGWYRISYSYTTTNAYNQRCLVGGAPSDGSMVAANASTMGVFGAQGEIATFASSYIPTAAATVTRAADTLSFPFGAVPQAMTVYADGVFNGAVDAGTNYGVALIGSSSSGVGPYFSARIDGGTIKGTTAHDNGPTLRTTSNTGTALAVSNRFELRGILNADGSCAVGLSVNGATEAVSSDTATNALAVAWEEAKLNVGVNVAGTQFGFNALHSLKIAAGVQTLATMRTLAIPSVTTTTNTLSPVSVNAFEAWAGQPRFTVGDTGTGALLTATATPLASQQARLFKLSVSFSEDVGMIPIQIFDGDTTILWQGYTSNTEMWYEDFDFSRKPLRSSPGNALSVVVPSGGVAVVGTVSWDGDFVRAP